MNATAETLELARDKARNLKSQGFYVQILDEDGELVLARLNWKPAQAVRAARGVMVGCA